MGDICMSNVIAYDDDKTSVLINDLVSLDANISKYLDDIDKIMSTVNDSLNGEVADSIKLKFNELSCLIPVLKENLSSYIEDFKVLSLSFKNKDASISLIDVKKNMGGGDIINVNNKI